MAWGSSEIAARSPGMVVVGVVVAPTRARAFPFKYFQRRRSGMALVYPTEPPREIGDQREGRLWGMKSGSHRQGRTAALGSVSRPSLEGAATRRMRRNRPFASRGSNESNRPEAAVRRPPFGRRRCSTANLHGLMIIFNPGDTPAGPTQSRRRETANGSGTL